MGKQGTNATKNATIRDSYSHLWWRFKLTRNFLMVLTMLVSPYEEDGKHESAGYIFNRRAWQYANGRNLVVGGGETIW